MIFTPEKYAIKDSPLEPFIDPDEIWNYINDAKPTKDKVNEIINKALSKKRLNLEEVAILVNTTDPELVDEIKKGAKILKSKIYGNRIVLFAPLYVGTKCTNNCRYCGFRVSNKDAIRKTLCDEELIREIEALEDNGQKRLILVYGEHSEYSPEFIAHTVRIAYSVKKGKGEIRRVNINAAPLDIDGFKIVKEAGIGTYQIFQESYHPEIYKYYHPVGKKADFNYRLLAMDRALEAGLDDVGLGVLFGLYDWRYEVLALVRHTNHLEACYNIGPHTISFPRVKNASNLHIPEKYFVSDDEFVKIVAILRLAVPYTGLILTAREPAHLRDEIIQYGVSQIDGGTNIEPGGYTKTRKEKNLNTVQFSISDDRSLEEVIDELINFGMIPSFCTACYRIGRTGEHFMEFSVPGFIKEYCTPNAILTFAEYLIDYASAEVAEKGWKLINENIDKIENERIKKSLIEKLKQLQEGKRDLYF